MTNGGWHGHVIKDMKNACTGAAIKNEMKIQFDSTGGSEQITSQDEVTSWINEVKREL